MRISEDFFVEFRKLRKEAVPEVDIDLGDEKDPMYRAGHINGFQLALQEVADLLEAEVLS